jgi:cell division protein FtsQ
VPKRVEEPKRKFNWRMALNLVVWTGVLAGMAWGAGEVDSFLMRDRRFELKSTDLQIDGAVYVSRAWVQSVFADDLGRSVFHIPLAERRRRVLAVDWVENASVFRLWPSRIIVSVTERTPLAFAKLPIAASGHFRFALIDRNGVLLSMPTRSRFRLPVLSGVTEEQTEAQRAVRVDAMQHLLSDLGPQAADVSEVNASDNLDMRLIVERDRHAVELWLGDQHYRSRYLNFVNHYEEIRRHSGDATVFDLRMDDRILAK